VPVLVLLVYSQLPSAPPLSLLGLHQPIDVLTVVLPCLWATRPTSWLPKDRLLDPGLLQMPLVFEVVTLLVLVLPVFLLLVALTVVRLLAVVLEVVVPPLVVLL
jgi:hypothetical protein